MSIGIRELLAMIGRYKSASTTDQMFVSEFGARDFGHFHPNRHSESINYESRFLYSTHEQLGEYSTRNREALRTSVTSSP
jgi:hypothetical protein